MAVIVRTPHDPVLAGLLQNHPNVTLAGAARGDGIEFEQPNWPRECRAGDHAPEVRGLVELMDNNPMVCCDVMSVPSPAGTLALIALGPLVRAGMLADDPALHLSLEADENDVQRWLATEGWSGEVNLQIDPADGAVATAVAYAEIPTPDDPHVIDEIFEEAYSRSFFVRRDEDSAWDAALVEGKPHANYRLRYSPGEATSLVTCMVLADRNGKLGAAQLVHAMNVMAGFEESLGIA